MDINMFAMRSFLSSVFIPSAHRGAVFSAGTFDRGCHLR